MNATVLLIKKAQFPVLFPLYKDYSYMQYKCLYIRCMSMEWMAYEFADRWVRFA